MVDPVILAEEIERLGLAGRAFVDGRCAVITPEHIRAKQEDPHLAGVVGSTCAGSGRARADSVLRRAQQARDHPDRITPRVRDLMSQVEQATGAPVTMLDNGPTLADLIDLEN